MAEVVKRLGATSPAADTTTALYTVPALTMAVLSTILVCNRSSVSEEFYLWHVDGGGVGAEAVADCIAFGHIIDPSASIAYRLGIGMEATDSITCRTTSATSVNFIAWGSEIS